VEVVERPSAIALDKSWISGVVRRFVEIVLANKDDTPSCDVTPSVETVAVLATMLDPSMVENVRFALVFKVLNVAVLAVMVETVNVLATVSRKAMSLV